MKINLNKVQNNKLLGEVKNYFLMEGELHLDFGIRQVSSKQRKQTVFSKAISMCKGHERNNKMECLGTLRRSALLEQTHVDVKL